ncbi:MAG: 2-oxoglutarate/2-oxoacid ferredoxin oxidoreductase subunit alpha [Thermoplasmata archaeon]|jgi:2-oxoglutarate ferredoxin oxidoreductase subunit alpha|nr:2-oxoglutarate/2-oxoacid ferredoxin oxidoreductase subunit alpha [Thermoplasmata archaeon]
MIGGEAGFGIMSSGDLLAKCLTHGGLWVYTNIEYPSLIRGGHNAIHVTASDEPIVSYYPELQCLIALNKETIDLHIKDVVKGGVIVYDGDEVQANDPAYAEHQARGVFFLSIPLKKLSEAAGGAITKNTVAVGAMLAFIGYPFHYIEEGLGEIFGKKGGDVMTMNVTAGRSGFEFVQKNFADKVAKFVGEHKDAPKRMLITGNQSTAIGFVQGGLKWYSAYPMTPATAILQTLIQYGEPYGVIAKQTEDELAAGLMAIGANYQGLRAACGTSGGGFALMVEGLGLAAIAEVPMVYVDVQRAGPATGLPTWSGQADLRFILHASQDEFPRFVIAPGDTKECFYAAFEALNLAEMFQVPVILMTDKNLAEHHQTWEPYNTKGLVINRGKLLKHGEAKVDPEYRKFARLEFTKDGVSPRTVPGQPGGLHTMASDEQNKFGDITEDPTNRTERMLKRFRKMEAMAKALPPPKFYTWAQQGKHLEVVEDKDPEAADLTIVCWGGTKGPAIESLKLLHKAGIKANVLHVMYIWPFPAVLGEMLEKCKRTVMVEANHLGQFEGLIREHLLRGCDARIHRLDGRPFNPIQLYRDLMKVTKGSFSDVLAIATESYATQEAK